MIVSKQPAEKVLVGFNFEPDLGAATIATVDSVTFAPDGELTEGDRDVGEQLVTLRVDGGTAGTTYAIEVTITASDGQVLALPGTVEVVAAAEADAAPNTAAGLKAAFPAFAAVPSSTVSFWLVRAARVVDDSWTEDDRAYAQALLAAHLMVTNGLGTGAEAEAAAAGASGFKVMRSGSLTLERFDNAGGAAGSYAGTSYGRQFATLLRQNRGGPLVTGTGTLPTRCYPWG